MQRAARVRRVIGPGQWAATASGRQPLAAAAASMPVTRIWQQTSLASGSRKLGPLLLLKGVSLISLLRPVKI